MTQHLSLDLNPAPSPADRTVADLCRRIGDTSGLPRRAEITFTLIRGELKSVGLEVSL